MYRRRQERAQIKAAIILFFLICIPVWLIRGCVAANSSNSEEDASLTPGPSPTVEVWDKETGSLINMDIEEYIVGVVAAEIPSSFDMEALKAQAVAARTYTVRKMHAYGGSGCSKGGDVCTDSAHCQAYRKLDSTWHGTEKEARIRQAVEATRGELLLYDDEPIEAVFHSTAGGYTEASENAFSSSRPYLKSVESNETEAPRYSGEKTVSRSTFASKINGLCSSANLSASRLEEQVSILSRYASGRVETVRVGEGTITGKQLRTLFGLDSTNATLEFDGENVIIHTKGFGHGVGMSQTGADQMAREGSSYQEILKHYYTGVTLAKYW